MRSVINDSTWRKHAQEYFQQCPLKEDIQTLAKRAPRHPAGALQEERSKAAQEHRRMTSAFQAGIPLAPADSLPSAHTRVAMRKALTTFFAFNESAPAQSVRNRGGLIGSHAHSSSKTISMSPRTSMARNESLKVRSSQAPY